MIVYLDRKEKEIKSFEIAACFGLSYKHYFVLLHSFRLPVCFKHQNNAT